MLLVALAIFYILLGCFLDGISIVVLTMAVLMPTIQAAGIDPLWFGIFVVVVVEMAQVTRRWASTSSCCRASPGAT